MTTVTTTANDVNEDQTPPTEEEVQQAIAEAEEVIDQVETYRSEANAREEQAEANNPLDRSLTLDESPFGEDLARTKDLPQQLEEAVKVLNQIESGAVPPAQAAQVFEQAQQVIQNAQETLADCTAIPEDDDSDEDD